MEATELQFFKELLLNQRAEILNKTASVRNEASIEATGQGDEGDLAVSEQTLAMTLRLQERNGNNLQKIDHTLAKIDEGSFGLCEQCEEELPKNRLLARPVANLCVACKEDQESRERVFA
jgi:DnaK suppressor protein